MLRFGWKRYICKGVIGVLKRIDLFFDLERESTKVGYTAIALPGRIALVGEIIVWTFSPFTSHYS